LTLLDFETIAANPKVFIGFSDITTLLTALSDHSGLVTFHGPVVTSLADASPETANCLVQAVSSDAVIDIKGFEGVTISAGSVSGVVCGGNLATLCHLIGTPFAPNLNNKILFLEDRAEPPYKIDRMLTQMKLSGCLDRLSGIALGSFEACGPLNDIYHIVDEAFRGASIPILAGLEVGHGKTNLTLPFGLPATMDADHHSLSYHQAATV
jgi:muramoyltetrapeptide carboxypeptidase